MKRPKVSRPRICKVNPTGVHTWNRRQYTKKSEWYCSYCSVTTKTEPKVGRQVKLQPIKCLFRNRHHCVLVDIRIFKFGCLTCPQEVTLASLIDEACDKTRKINNKTPYPIYNYVKEHLRMNGRPLGISRITIETIANFICEDWLKIKLKKSKST